MFSSGGSIEETKRNIREAVQLHLESLIGTGNQSRRERASSTSRN